jgi:hypothetical protein
MKTGASRPEILMKKFAIILFVFISLVLAAPASAQSAESIWIAASAPGFKTGETVIVSVNGISATPIQGMTFQIRFDPACLKANNAASPIVGMNGLPLPQLTGLVDASFASTTPVIANGLLAEVRLTALGACETNLTLESAALVIKNESGFAAPLPGVTLDRNPIPLSLSGEQGVPNDAPLLGTPLPLGTEPEESSSASLPTGIVIVLAAIGVLLLVGIFVLIRILKRDNFA